MKLRKELKSMKEKKGKKNLETKFETKAKQNPKPRLDTHFDFRFVIFEFLQ